MQLVLKLNLNLEQCLLVCLEDLLIIAFKQATDSCIRGVSEDDNFLILLQDHSQLIFILIKFHPGY